MMKKVIVLLIILESTVLYASQLRSENTAKAIYASIDRECDIKTLTLYTFQNDYHPDTYLHDETPLMLVPVNTGQFAIVYPLNLFYFAALTVGPSWVEWNEHIYDWEIVELQKVECNNMPNYNCCYCIHGISQNTYVRGWGSRAIDTSSSCIAREKWRIYTITSFVDV